EDAANEVGALTVTTSGAYRGLTDAIGGHGNLEDARYRFEMEAALLASAQDADGDDWQHWFMRPRRRCVQCGNAEIGTNPWINDAGCNECFANANPSGADLDAHDHWATPGILSERPWRPK